MPFQYFTTRSSSYRKYSASISLVASSWSLLSAAMTTRQRLMSLIWLLRMQNSAPSLTTFSTELTSILFQSCLSSDFQQMQRQSCERYTNLSWGQLMFYECLIIRQPFLRFISTQCMVQDSELSSLLRLRGERDGLRLISLCTSPMALPSKSRILVMRSAVLGGTLQGRALLCSRVNMVRGKLIIITGVQYDQFELKTTVTVINLLLIINGCRILWEDVTGATVRCQQAQASPQMANSLTIWQWVAKVYCRAQWARCGPVAFWPRFQQKYLQVGLLARNTCTADPHIFPPLANVVSYPYLESEPIKYYLGRLLSTGEQGAVWFGPSGIRRWVVQNSTSFLFGNSCGLPIFSISNQPMNKRQCSRLPACSRQHQQHPAPPLPTHAKLSHSRPMHHLLQGKKGWHKQKPETTMCFSFQQLSLNNNRWIVLDTSCTALPHNYKSQVIKNKREMGSICRSLTKKSATGLQRVKEQPKSLLEDQQQGQQEQQEQLGQLGQLRPGLQLFATNKHEQKSKQQKAAKLKGMLDQIQFTQLASNQQPTKNANKKGLPNKKPKTARANTTTPTLDNSLLMTNLQSNNEVSFKKYRQPNYKSANTPKKSPTKDLPILPSATATYEVKTTKEETVVAFQMKQQPQPVGSSINAIPQVENKQETIGVIELLFDPITLLQIGVVKTIMTQNPYQWFPLWSSLQPIEPESAQPTRAIDQPEGSREGYQLKKSEDQVNRPTQKQASQKPSLDVPEIQQKKPQLQSSRQQKSHRQQRQEVIVSDEVAQEKPHDQVRPLEKAQGVERPLQEVVDQEIQKINQIQPVTLLKQLANQDKSHKVMHRKKRSLTTKQTENMLNANEECFFFSNCTLTPIHTPTPTQTHTHTPSPTHNLQPTHNLMPNHDLTPNQIQKLQEPNPPNICQPKQDSNIQLQVYETIQQPSLDETVLNQLDSGKKASLGQASYLQIHSPSLTLQEKVTKPIVEDGMLKPTVQDRMGKPIIQRRVANSHQASEAADCFNLRTLFQHQQNMKFINIVPSQQTALFPLHLNNPVYIQNNPQQNSLNLYRNQEMVALLNLFLKVQPKQLQEIFQTPHSNKYYCRLYDEWGAKVVAVDGVFPFSSNYYPLYGRVEQYIWFSVLVKCIAQLKKSYKLVQKVEFGQLYKMITNSELASIRQILRMNNGLKLLRRLIKQCKEEDTFLIAIAAKNAHFFKIESVSYVKSRSQRQEQMQGFMLNASSSSVNREQTSYKTLETFLSKKKHQICHQRTNRNSWVELVGAEASLKVSLDELLKQFEVCCRRGVVQKVMEWG